MFSLQSDFSRHSLTKLFGAAELRMIIFSYTSVVLCHPQATPFDQIVLNQSLRPTPSASLQVWLGKAKSSDVAQTIPQCFYAVMDLEMLPPTKKHLKLKTIYL